MSRVAIVGAGLSGLILGRALAGEAEVVLFEKSRGPGGRMATRDAPPFAFDHGAQFFTARSDAFLAFLAPLAAAGVVASWTARFAEVTAQGLLAQRRWGAAPAHYVAVPRMNALGKHLARGLDVRTQTQVAAVTPAGERWRLTGADGAALGVYDWVLMTAPAAQTAALMPRVFDASARLARVGMRGCYALMLGLEAPPELPFDAALVRNADLSWISVNASKPGRPAAPTLVALASNAWADAHLDADPETVGAHLYRELVRVIGGEPGAVAHQAVHRWRYANVGRQTGPRSLLDARRRLGACGDWCVYGRVEGAFLSATDLVRRLRPHLR